MSPYTSRHASQSLRRVPAPPTRFERSDFTESQGQLVACASDLGWRAGQWPEKIVVEPGGDSFSPAQSAVTYYRGHAAVHPVEGELLSVTYSTREGHTPILVYND
jgi:hypothetical protein